nr:Zon1B-L [Andraca theae]
MLVAYLSVLALVSGVVMADFRAISSSAKAGSCPRCGVNETPISNQVLCPPDTCESIYSSYTCEDIKPTKCGCKCIDKYLRNSNNTCVPSEKCPPPNPCGPNGTLADCGFRCPNQYCPEDDSLGIILCKPPRDCQSGCLCKENYKRVRADDTCVLAFDCPVVNCTRPNEVWDPCSRCLAERCSDVATPNMCDDPPGTNCDPRCVCAKGHCRNEDDICVPKKSCSDISPHKNQCMPTCAVPTPKNCQYTKPGTTDDDGCQTQCEEGYIMSEKGGKCIKVEDCPKDLGCNGDPNASVKVCPQPCPSTCNSPNAMDVCKRKCDPIGCQCNPGYILSEIDGKCILPDNCSGGNPCGPGGRFVECRTSCPYDYCPVDDSRAVVACEYPPFASCFSGCICGLNHKRLSYSDHTCVVSSDCPPVDCTRPNEEWSPCPSDCLSELCKDVDKKPIVCNTFVLNCQPKCICKENHFRNESEICVSAKVCRKLNAMNMDCDS